MWGDAVLRTIKNGLEQELKRRFGIKTTLTGIKTTSNGIRIMKTVWNRQQPSPLLYSIDTWPAGNSRLTQRETNHYITRCASEIAWPYLAGSSPGQLVIYLFAQHHLFAVRCQCTILSYCKHLNVVKSAILDFRSSPIVRTFMQSEFNLDQCAWAGASYRARIINIRRSKH